ncbi:MAG: glycosyltransferase family A protein [Veillonellales bacterium]
MKNEYPLVSVVLTTYNRVKLLGETVQSILAQTFTNFELIIVDNMSEDGTREYVLGINDSRIRYMGNLNNGVIAVNRNVGIKSSRGKYIAFCDDDDLWMPDKLQHQVVFMEENSDLGLCFGYAIAFGDTKFSGRMLNAKNECNNIANFKTLVQGNKIACFTVMLRKDCLIDVGIFDENPDFRAIEDFDLWLRIAKIYKIACLPKILGRYRVQNNSASSNKVTERKKLFKLMEKLEADQDIDRSTLKKAKAQIFWMVGNALLSNKDNEYKKWFSESFIYDRNIKTFLAILLTWLPTGFALSLFNVLEKIKVHYTH